MASISDVAKQAKVSLSTVSRVFNHRETVHPETRERVEKVMSRLRYRPRDYRSSSDSTAVKRMAFLYTAAVAGDLGRGRFVVMVMLTAARGIGHRARGDERRAQRRGKSLGVSRFGTGSNHGVHVASIVQKSEKINYEEIIDA